MSLAIKTTSNNKNLSSNSTAVYVYSDEALELAAFQLHKDVLLHAALESTLKGVKAKIDYYYSEGFFSCDETYLRSLQALELALEQVLSVYSTSSEGHEI